MCRKNITKYAMLLLVWLFCLSCKQGGTTLPQNLYPEQKKVVDYRTLMWEREHGLLPMMDSAEAARADRELNEFLNEDKQARYERAKKGSQDYQREVYEHAKELNKK